MPSNRSMKAILHTIAICMGERLNVLLTGDHGVGKTQIIRREAHRQGVVVKYFSCATLDPWCATLDPWTDIVGVPIPIDAEAGPEGKRLLFVQPQALRDAELLFLDEFNRSAPKVLNAMMEAIQFHTINGEPLPKLQMVWAAVNPADSGYEVSTFTSRFRRPHRQSFTRSKRVSRSTSRRHSWIGGSEILTIVCGARFLLGVWSTSVPTTSRVFRHVIHYPMESKPRLRICVTASTNRIGCRWS